MPGGAPSTPQATVLSSTGPAYHLTGTDARFYSNCHRVGDGEVRRVTGWRSWWRPGWSLTNVEDRRDALSGTLRIAYCSS